MALIINEGIYTIHAKACSESQHGFNIGLPYVYLHMCFAVISIRHTENDFISYYPDLNNHNTDYFNCYADN